MQQEYQLALSANEIDSTLKNIRDKIDDVVLKQITYEADKIDLSSIVRKAQPGATIQLKAKKYSRLDLHNKNSYPENLTIIGTEGSKIDGISITSGIIDTDINKDLGTHRNNADISGAILPQGLTIKNVTFTNHFSLRNASIDNLTIDGCTFTNGCCIHIHPNTMYDCYGKDYIEGKDNFVTRIASAALCPKNIVIKNCTIENANASSQGTGAGDSAIRIIGCDDVVIYKNTINGAGFNGINISGLELPHIKSHGKIAVTNNIIRNTGSRSIRMAYLKDATVMLHNNELYSANQAESNSEFVKLNYCTDVEFNIGVGASVNNYEENSISVGNGITAVSDISDVKLVASGRSGDWFYRKYSDGSADCWMIKSIPTTDVCYIVLPFTFVSSEPTKMGDIQVTIKGYPVGYITLCNGCIFAADTFDTELNKYISNNISLRLELWDALLEKQYEGNLDVSVHVTGLWK